MFVELISNLIRYRSTILFEQSLDGCCSLFRQLAKLGCRTVISLYEQPRRVRRVFENTNINLRSEDDIASSGSVLVQIPRVLFLQAHVESLVRWISVLPQEHFANDVSGFLQHLFFSVSCVPASEMCFCFRVDFFADSEIHCSS